jgi:hypothetical protein
VLGGFGFQRSGLTASVLGIIPDTPSLYPENVRLLLSPLPPGLFRVSHFLVSLIGCAWRRCSASCRGSLGSFQNDFDQSHCHVQKLTCS